VPESVILQSAATFALSAALAVYVALQRRRTPLQATVLALLCAFMAWTVGVLMIFGSDFDPLLSRIGAIIVYIGVMGAAPLWLFVCARIAKVPLTVEQPRATVAALFTPTLLLFAAFVSDPWHGLFAGGASAAMFTDPVATWAGPLFWVHTGWCYFCTVTGIVLCVRAARRAGPVDHWRFTLVALGAGFPLVTMGITMTGLLPEGLRLTPADLGVSAVLLVTAVLRYRFLESNGVPARDVIAHLHEALFLADANEIVVDANPAAQRMLDQPLGALRGRSLADVAGELAPELDLDAWREGSPDVPMQTVATASDRVLDFSYARVLAGDAVIGSFVVVRDRTEQHRSDRSRHQSQRLESLGVLVAGIAHEINNPLAFVRTNLAHLGGLADLVNKQLDSFEPHDASALSEMSEVILETQGGIDRISRIVDATRKLSREPQTTRQLVDVNQIVESAIHIAAMHANRAVEVTTELAETRPRVYGSAEQLGQVLLNLLINAKQATESSGEGRIHVETRQVDGSVEVLIHDNGPGVDPADRDSIFDPFFTTKGPDEGTGLGLAIAFDIAKEHNGSLGVTASELGGACFALVLEAIPQ
jgi:signal transduction histidine kinase